VYNGLKEDGICEGTCDGNFVGASDEGVELGDIDDRKVGMSVGLRDKA